MQSISERGPGIPGAFCNMVVLLLAIATMVWVQNHVLLVVEAMSQCETVLLTAATGAATYCVGPQCHACGQPTVWRVSPILSSDCRTDGMFREAT